MASFRSITGAFALLGLAAACSDRAPRIEQAGAAAWSPSAVEGRVAHDFVAQHAAAERWMEVGEIEPARLMQREFLTEGWSYPPHSRDEDKPERWPLWADATHAEVSFPLREVARRRIELRINPYNVPLGKKGTIDVALTLNGGPLTECRLDRSGKKLSLELPTELQRADVNRLGFSFPRVWRISEESDADDPRRIVANVGPIRFVVEDGEARRRLAEARALAPEGSRVARTGPGAGLAVEQVSGSILRHHVLVPDEARFVARIFYGARGQEQPAAAAFRVVATPDGGEPETLVDGTVAYGAEPVELAAPLAAYAGRVVRFDFQVAAADGSKEPVLGTWIQPLLVTGAPPVTREAPEGLARAREALRGAPVVLVLLDACNPSYLSCYGGRPGLTPNIDRLADEGATFEAAHSQASYTIASVPSTLTSLLSWEHGSWNEHGKLLDGVPTWPERFRASGYRTLGIVHSPNGSSLFGFERGFERFDEVFLELRPDRETALAEQVLPALDAALAEADERPPFLWLHIVEPHEPYLPPPPFRGSLSEPSDDTIRADSETLWKIRDWKLVPTPDQLRELRTQYEENLAYVDDVLGRVRERLEAAGIWDRAVVAVFSDHGEGFLEHEGKILAGCGHGSTVYEEMTRIPLLVRLPEALAPHGRRVPTLTANIDLIPTVADLVGVPALEGTRGESFAPQLFADVEPARELVLSHSASFMDERRFLPVFALWWRGWKYVHTSGDRGQLFDLSADPGESTNLVEERPILAGFLRQELRAFSGFDVDHGDVDFEGRAATEIDEDLEAQLRALGYGR